MRNLRRGAVVFAMALAAAAGAAGCGGDSSTGPAPSPSDTIAGNFTLQKVNNVSLPATVASDPGNYSLQITAGSAALVSTGSQFTIAVTSKETVAGHASTYIDSTSGTWSQAIGNITFLMTSGGTTTSNTATWDGSNLTIVQDGDTYIFKKN